MGVIGRKRMSIWLSLIQVPLSKVGGCIARFTKGGGEHLFLLVDRVSNAKRPGTIIATTREHRRPGRRATGRAGIESVHPQSIASHVVEIRRFHEGITVITGLRPTHVVCHHKYHVRAIDLRVGHHR